MVYTRDREIINREGIFARCVFYVEEVVKYFVEMKEERK